MSSIEMDVVVIGAGPAGMMAALRAADLGARTMLVARDAYGGMAGLDGPVPVRALAHAARLIREARQLDRYGVAVGEPALDYPRLLERVREVVDEVGRRSSLRPQIDAAGVAVVEKAGLARFSDSHRLEIGSRHVVKAERFIICTGGSSRQLPIPGFELTATHSDAWGLAAVPPSMLVVGAGATGAQVASVFGAFGARVQLFEAGDRILRTEDEDVSAAMAAAFRERGIRIHESFGTIRRFEAVEGGVAMVYEKDGTEHRADAALVVTALGWQADTAALNLEAAGVLTDARGFVSVDLCLQTSARHIYAAGDVTGGLMLVPQALQAGFLAATNAVTGSNEAVVGEITPIGSFTDPEYAQVGLTEAAARRHGEVEVATIGFDMATRAIIDGRTTGFCKLVIDRGTRQILGCHIVGDRAVDIVQVAAVAMAAGMPVDELARLALPFPTYTGILGRAAATATRRLNRESAWRTSVLVGVSAAPL